MDYLVSPMDDQLNHNKAADLVTRYSQIIKNQESLERKIKKDAQMRAMFAEMADQKKKARIRKLKT